MMQILATILPRGRLRHLGYAIRLPYIDGLLALFASTGSAPPIPFLANAEVLTSDWPTCRWRGMSSNMIAGSRKSDCFWEILISFLPWKLPWTVLHEQMKRDYNGSMIEISQAPCIRLELTIDSRCSKLQPIDHLQLPAPAEQVLARTSLQSSSPIRSPRSL
jgi:hypothetical protein